MEVAITGEGDKFLGGTMQAALSLLAFRGEESDKNPGMRSNFMEQRASNNLRNQN